MEKFNGCYHNISIFRSMLGLSEVLQPILSEALLEGSSFWVLEMVIKLLFQVLCVRYSVVRKVMMQC